MRLGFRMKRWIFEFEIGWRTFRAKVPLQLKLMFYIGLVLGISVAILSTVCIVLSLQITKRLMSQRLAQFAIIKAQQTERSIHNQALTLGAALQGEFITRVIKSFYLGNVSNADWASHMDEMTKALFGTTLRPVQMLTFYDNRGDILFSKLNPGLSTDTARQLQLNLKTLLPLGYVLNGTNTTLQVTSNSTKVQSMAAQQASNAVMIQSRTSESRATATSSPPEQPHVYKPPIQFVDIDSEATSWVSLPVPLFDSKQTIVSYSYSFTSPVNSLQVVDSVQASSLIAYCTAVYDCSAFMNGTFAQDSSEVYTPSPRTSDNYKWEPNSNTASSSVIGMVKNRWNYLLPSEKRELNKTHSIADFPAVEADLIILQKYERGNNSSKPGEAIMDTTAPNIRRASVGFSFVNAINQKWFILISVSRSNVETGYHTLLWKLGLTAPLIFMALMFCVFVATELIVAPVYKIYNGMELKTRQYWQSHEHNGTKKSYWSGRNQEKPEESYHGKMQYTKLKQHGAHMSAHNSSSTLVEPHNHGTQNQVNNMIQVSRSLQGDHKELSAHASEISLNCLNSSQQSHNNGSSSNSKRIMSIPASLLGSIEASLASSIRTVTRDQTTGEDEQPDESELFHVPSKLEPLHRWWKTDEFDELVDVYNRLVDRLVAHQTRIEDEVRLRTREARESQRLAETANAAKSMFMMNISHELLTPMNGIMGIAAVSLEEPDLQQVTSGLQTIIQSGNILRELLNELLTYAAHLAGVEKSLQKVNIEKFASRIRETFATRAEAKGVSFVVDVCPPPLQTCQIECDFERIMHVCTSLVSNGIKFSDSEKLHELGVNVEREPRVCVHIYLRKSDRDIEPSMKIPAKHRIMLEIIVSDNGAGISRERLAHIFEVFEQGEDALSKRFKGTGLGLAMSKLLCETLGGCIIVSSRENVGSVVKFEVPVQKLGNVNLKIVPPGRSFAFETDWKDADPDQIVWGTTSRTPGQVHNYTMPRYHRYIEKFSPLRQISTTNSVINGTLRTNGDRVSILNSSLDHSVAAGTNDEGSVASIATATTASVFDNSNVGMIDSPIGSTITTGKSTSIAGGSIGAVSESEQSIPVGTSIPLESVLEKRNEKEVQLDMSLVRVLVADDNDLLRSLYDKMLRHIGVGHIDLARSGAEGIEYVESAIVEGTRYMIIFMDLEMPETDGVTATRFIWRQLGYRCPIVALTGHSDPESIERCHAQGISEVLVKPVLQDQLAETIHKILKTTNPDETSTDRL